MVAAREDYSYGDDSVDYGFGGGDVDADGDYPDPDGDLGNEIAPQDEDGNFVVGDMILSPEQYDFEYGTGGDGDGPIDSGIRGNQFRWNNRVVPYGFARGISEAKMWKRSLNF